MRQRFTFIKTNEVEEDFDEEERVELETVIENTDLEALEEKFENFLKGCGYNKVVEIMTPEEEDDDDDDEWDDEDLEDELDDVEEDKS